MRRGRRAGAIVRGAMSPRRIAEAKLVLLAAGAVIVMLLCIVAIAHTDAVWLVLLTALAIALIGGAIVLDMRRVIAASGDTAAPVEAPPGRAIVVSTTPMTAEQVLEAVGPAGGETRSIMVVCPAGLQGAGLIVDDHDYARAHRVEAETVAALRRAGINAAGQVGDRNPSHAVEDALALFPARTVVVVARALEADVYREHLDADELQRELGVELQVREVAPAE
jgi:hypothetical protein